MINSQNFVLILSPPSMVIDGNQIVGSSSWKPLNV
jgi:hypothetical protein